MSPRPSSRAFFSNVKDFFTWNRDEPSDSKDTKKKSFRLLTRDDLDLAPYTKTHPSARPSYTSPTPSPIFTLRARYILVEYSNTFSSTSHFTSDLLFRLPPNTRIFGGTSTPYPLGWSADAHTSRWVFIEFPDGSDKEDMASLLGVPDRNSRGEVMRRGDLEGPSLRVEVPGAGEGVREWMEGVEKRHRGEWAGVTVGKRFEVRRGEVGGAEDGIYVLRLRSARYTVLSLITQGGRTEVVERADEQLDGDDVYEARSGIADAH